MGNGATRSWRVRGRASSSADVVSDDLDVEIDLRSGDPAISLRSRAVQGASDAVELESVPGDHVADVVPLFESPVHARPTTEPATDVAFRVLPVRGMLGRAISRADSEHATGLAYEASKRASDMLVSTLLFLLLLPLLIVLFVLVRVTSPGPALYRQERIGRDGTLFTIFKFRTMSIDADQRLDEMVELAERGEVSAVDGPVFKAPDDPRVTKVGRFLRRTNLDELPQVLNILAGQMSLVGPRPLVAEEVETLDSGVATSRHAVRPGITCLWQVLRTDDMSFDERMELDLVYNERRSFSLDMVLVMLTPIAVVRGSRSY